MTDDDISPADRPPAKMITALLREARSLSRRADKLGATAATGLSDLDRAEVARRA